MTSQPPDLLPPTEKEPDSDPDSGLDLAPDPQPQGWWTTVRSVLRMPRLPKWLVGLLLLGLLLGGGYFAYSRHQTEQRQARRRQMQAQAVTVQRLTLPVVIPANGTVQPQQLVNLSPKTSGVLKVLLVQEGQTVQTGQIVARMDNSNLLGQLQQAQGQLASAKANLAKLIAGNRVQDIQQARAQLVAAQANLRQAKTNLDQNLKLYRAGAISQRDYDTSRTSYDTALAEVARLKQSLNLQQAGSRPEDIAQARAQVVTAQGQLQTIQTQVNDTIIRAPFAGVVSRIFAKPGSFVTPTTSGSAVTSATSSSILALASKNEIVAKVPETNIARLQLQQPVTIEADAYPNQTFTGRVTQIAIQSTVEQNVTNFEVRASINDPRRQLRAGMNVEIRFNVGTLNHALMIPTVAIVRQEGGTGVLLLERGRGRPRFQPITTGVTVETQTEVLSGLKPGQRILMSFPTGERPPGRTPSIFPGMGGPGGGGGGGGGRRGGF